MMTQYEGTLRLEVTAMAADERHGFVWARESASRPDDVAYTGVHAWGFNNGRCSRFESYDNDAYYDFWRAPGRVGAGRCLRRDLPVRRGLEGGQEMATRPLHSDVRHEAGPKPEVADGSPVERRDVNSRLTEA